MKLSLLFKSLFIGSLSGFVLARDDCKEIKDFLTTKIRYYNEYDGSVTEYTLDEDLRKCKMNSSGEVTEISMYSYCLSEDDINKVISYPTIESLTFESLNIYHSSVLDPIRYCGNMKNLPSGISKLKNLKSLDLFGYNNYKEGDISSIPKSVTKLRLSNYKITQFVIDELKNLPNLENLHLTYNKSFDELDFSSLTFIKELTFSTDEGTLAYMKKYFNMSFLENLNQFSTLNFIYYSFNQTLIDQLSEYNNIKELKFFYCGFDEDVSIEPLSKLTNLEDLEIVQFNKYCGDSPSVFDDNYCPLKEVSKSIYSMTNLKKLVLSYQDNPYLNSIDNLQNLEYLDISHEKLDKLPDAIENLKNLEYLDLSYNSIKEIPDFIGNLKNLKTLILDSNKNLSSIPSFICSLPNLKNLSYKSTKITEGCPETTTTTTTTTTTSTITTATTTTTTTTTTTSTIVPTSTVPGRCGAEYGACQEGYCCSKWGYCGKTSAYCGTGCQSGFGECQDTDIRVTTLSTSGIEAIATISSDVVDVKLDCYNTVPKEIEKNKNKNEICEEVNSTEKSCYEKTKSADASSYKFIIHATGRVCNIFTKKAGLTSIIPTTTTTTTTTSDITPTPSPTIPNITTTSTTTTTTTTSTSVPTSTVPGRCGAEYGACQKGYCCSKWGYCGKSSAYCGTGCQSGFGVCEDTEITSSTSPTIPSITTTTSTTTTTVTTTSTTTTTTTTTTTISTTVSTSTVPGRCGAEYGACQKGYCCSKWGYCGKSSAYCGTGCQSGFGKCN